MPVQLTNRQRRFPVDTAILMRRAEGCLEKLGASGAELSVLLVNDRPMRALNRDYRGKNQATDVLSFPMYEGPPEQVAIQWEKESGPQAVLGDVIISVETAFRQATENGVKPDEELALLLIHGLLHLLGHDHETGGRQAKTMARAEGELLAHLGLTAHGLVGRASQDS